MTEWLGRVQHGLVCRVEPGQVGAMPASMSGGCRRRAPPGESQETTPERIGTDALTRAGKGRQLVVACTVIVAPPLTAGEHELQHALQRDFHPLRPIIELVAQLVDSFFEQKSVQ